MLTKISFLPRFRKQLDRLARKFPLLFKDMDQLVDELDGVQLPGDQIHNLAYEIYKVHLPNRSAKTAKAAVFESSIM